MEGVEYVMIKGAKIRVDMSKLNYLEILRRALLNAKIQKELFSIGGYKEQSFCIEENDSKWVVYLGERGVKHDLEEFKSPTDACRRLIARVSESDEEEAYVKRQFDSVLNKSRSKAITTSVVMEPKKDNLSSFECVVKQSKAAKKRKYTTGEPGGKSLKKGFR